MNPQAAIHALVDAGVEFLIIGGWSAIFHGSTHTTKDLDIFFPRTSENVRRLAAALAPYHPVLSDLPEGLPFVWDARTLRNGTIFTLRTDVGRIDLLAEVSGLGPYDEVATHAVEVEAFGRRVRTLDLKSLIKSKRAANREKDQGVLREMESLLEAESE